MRMLDPKGWTLPALCVEFGAGAAYTVVRRDERSASKAGAAANAVSCSATSADHPIFPGCVCRSWNRVF